MVVSDLRDSQVTDTIVAKASRYYRRNLSMELYTFGNQAALMRVKAHFRHWCSGYFGTKLCPSAEGMLYLSV